MDDVEVANPRNVMHQASFYIERLKYGDGPRAVELVAADSMSEQVEHLLQAAGVTDLTADEFNDAASYYGRSFSRQFGGSALVAKSIFVDGIMHGLALAAGLRGESRGV